MEASPRKKKVTTVNNSDNSATILKDKLLETFAELSLSHFTYKFNNQNLRRVTSLVKSVTPVFDSDGISRELSIDRGIPQHEILKEWKATAEKGTDVHEYISSVLSCKEARPVGHIEEKAFDYFWKENSPIYEVVVSEQSVGDLRLNAAGTIDCILYNKVENKFQLIDWKTGKFYAKAYNNGETLLHPFDDLENCKLSIASLQLRMYELLLRQSIPGIELANPLIVHLHYTGESIAHNALRIEEDKIVNWLIKSHRDN